MPTRRSWILTCVAWAFLFMGYSLQASSQDLWPKESLPATSRLQVNGFYRFAATYLDEKVPYPRVADQVNTLPGRQIFVGDDAQLPNLWLNVKGKPGGNLSWSFDLFAFQFLNGKVGAAYSPPVVNSARPSLYAPLASARLAPSLGMNLGMNLSLQWSDRWAAHQLRLGGIHWYSFIGSIGAQPGHEPGHESFVAMERSLGCASITFGRNSLVFVV